MKIAIYTLTRDRLEYTRHCFGTLLQNAGYPFDHFILDNGSQDGTPEWIREHYRPKFFHQRDYNIGISRGSNFLLGKILYESDYDLIIKMDNDCEVLTSELLRKVVILFETLLANNINMLLSPRVEGINRQPNRAYYLNNFLFRIGVTGIIGGLFHIVPAAIYRKYRYPENLALAKGQDDHFCNWARENDILKGYIEDLVVNHYEKTTGQAEWFPEYFERKWKEEKLS
jgi:GT2 family glycosyltransferase